MKGKAELLFLIFLVATSAFLRFSQLGYSHFYGDETKTLYSRKDVSAQSFLMNQRKAPFQYLVVWTTEKLSGGFNEGHVRFPFALAGTLLVLTFYFYVRGTFGIRPAIFAVLFFSLSGFNIAFSRTAQYQVFYLLFGFASLLLAQKSKFLLSGLFLGLSLLSHYDGIFFLIPLYYLSGKKYFLKVAVVSVLVASVYYVPNILLGYFETNTFGYIVKRAAGAGYLQNNSLYTILVYNPLYLFPGALFVFSLIGLACCNKLNSARPVIVWFAAVFILFQFFTLNPGTHVHNYLIPIYILAGLGLEYVINKSGRLAYWILLPLYAAVLLVQSWTYIPYFNTGYPWKSASLAGINVERVKNDYHLYLYGFPYYREWDKISHYLSTLNGVRNFYTNDNQTVAEYYFSKAPYRAPGTGFLPQYYIEIENTQELKAKSGIPKAKYELVAVENTLDARIYKKLPYGQEI